MAVVPVQVPVSTSVPALTLAAGSAGGVAVASTIDPVNDYIGIYTASATATQGINRNTYLGITGAPVGTTDSQTLTNKTLTNPTINAATLSGTLSGTYTIGGTPTFPSSVMTLTGTQTATNKTFTSPILTAPTITNATISADALTGFTTTNTGTVYGISVASGVFTSSNIIPTASIQNASITPNKLSIGAATANVATLQTTTSTSFTDLATAGPAVTVTIGTNGLALVILSASLSNATGGDYAVMGYAVSGANTIAANFNSALANQTPGGVSSVNEITASYSILLTGLTVGPTTFTAKYEVVTGGTASFRNRNITVIPL